MTPEEQLALWVKGDSRHNHEDKEGGCVPDFSCCQKDLLAPEETRVRFCRAVEEVDWNTVDVMLTIFLGRMLQFNYGDKIHFVELDSETEMPLQVTTH